MTTKRELRRRVATLRGVCSEASILIYTWVESQDGAVDPKSLRHMRERLLSALEATDG